MVLLGLMLGMGLLSGPVEAKKIYGHWTVTRVNRVYDGDTFYVDVAGVHPIIGQNIPIRIHGVDTPEMNDPDPKVRERAIQARDFLHQQLRAARVIELRHIRRGKYFRVVADVYADKQNVGQMLIDNGLARPYR